MSFAHLPSETIDAILIHLPINHDLINIALASKRLLAPFLLASEPFANRHCNYQASFIDNAQFKKHSLVYDAVTYIVPCPRKYLTIQYWIYRCLLEGPAKNRYAFILNRLRSMEMTTALKKGFNSIARILLVEGVTISDTHLDIAATTGNAELVPLFLEHSNIRGVGSFALQQGINSGDPNTVSILVAHPKVHWDKLYSMRWTLLPDAIEDTRFQHGRTRPKQTEIVRILLSHPKIEPSCSALIAAIQRRNFEVIDLLLKDPRIDPWIHRGCLCKLACRLGKVDLLGRLLLDPRLNTLSDIDSLILLRIGFKRRDPQIVELLVRHMKVNHVLKVATEYQNVKVLEQLGLLNMLGPDYEDSNALRVACLDGNADVVRLLLLKRWERTENESLEWAAIGGSVEVATDAGGCWSQCICQ